MRRNFYKKHNTPRAVGSRLLPTAPATIRTAGGGPVNLFDTEQKEIICSRLFQFHYASQSAVELSVTSLVTVMVAATSIVLTKISTT